MTPSAKPIVLVTGSSGLIGTKVQEALSRDYQVVGLDKVSPDAPIAGTEFLEVDLTSDASVDEVLGAVRRRFGSRIASCIHLAAYYDFSGEPSPLYQKLTVEGTRRLITRLSDFEVEQFLFSSSLLVMEPVERGDPPITERDPTRAEWDYPASKLEAEEVLREEHGEIPVVVLRIAGVYDEEGHSLPVTQQMRRIFEQELESFVFPGNAEHGQPFVHLDDLVSCLRLAVDRRAELGPWEVFLIAEPEVMSYQALQDTLGTLIHGEKWPAIRIPKTVAKAGAWVKEQMPGSDPFIKPWMVDLADDHYPVAITRARTRLGWEPAHRLRESLDSMVAALKRDPRRWYEANKLPLPEHLAEAR